MLLLAGLGNPGRRYADNRHNAGYRAADEIVRRHGFSASRKRFQGLVAEGVLGGEKTLVLKPETFMNRSGDAIAEAVRFYKLEPADVVVIHDEIDLAPGKIRIKTGGGLAGNNGLRSIAAHIGRDFRRIRIGVGHPGHKDKVEGYVLRDFPKADRAWLEDAIDAIAEAAAHLPSRRDADFSNKLGLLLKPNE